MGKIAIYPGSFDPITNGHVDIIERAQKLFDNVIVSILHNPAKNALFTVEERIDLIETSLKGMKNVTVQSFNGLLVDFAEQVNADVIIRGMRAVSDFDNEFHMAMMNRRLNRKIQTVFLMTGMRWVFTSSSGIKEVAAFGGSVEGIVPPYVEQKLKEKY
ncbi:MAG: pantetheine-phosphate adenylyltransferase [Desulfobacterales bacterium]|nr:pantetheine-phosphate adenylyltransferase [Desulfobacterales bacterium]MCP4160931.1 pantetheine-phosphate adenylyltransferase [Deltaproteobacteria bacterium]